MALAKCINIHGGQEVRGGGQGGATAGVMEHACHDGGVSRSRAVAGAEIYHFKKR